MRFRPLISIHEIVPQKDLLLREMNGIRHRIDGNHPIEENPVQKIQDFHGEHLVQHDVPGEKLSIIQLVPGMGFDEHLGALTGPASRDDAPAVLAHLEALRQLSENSADPNSHDLHLRYLPMAERTAQAAGSPEVERALMAYRSEHGLPGGLT